MKKKYKIIYIEWIDAFSNASWFNMDELDKWKGNDCWVREVGYLIDENKNYIVMAARFACGEPNHVQFGQVQKIPKTWIRKKKFLGWLTI